MERDGLLAGLELIPLFSGLSGEQRGFLAGDASFLEVKRGTMVCAQGEQPGGFFCVIEGCVKLAMRSPGGAERVVEIMGAGRSFGESTLFPEQPWTVYAQALGASRLIFVNRRAVIAGIRRWPNFSLLILAGLSARVQGLLNDLEACCLNSARQRVIRYLLSEQRPYSCESGAGLVSLPAGKAVIASALNLTPETFSRELRQLAAQGLIGVQKNSIYIPEVNELRNASG